MSKKSIIGSAMSRLLWSAIASREPYLPTVIKSNKSQQLWRQLVSILDTCAMTMIIRELYNFSTTQWPSGRLLNGTATQSLLVTPFRRVFSTWLSIEPGSERSFMHPIRD
jgi:hypothetical protein